MTGVTLLRGERKEAVMTKEQKIKVLAELDEYELQTRSDFTFWHPTKNRYFLKHEMPQYLTSYDAIIPLVRRQPLEVRRDVYRNVTNFASTVDIGNFTNFSPQELSDALIKAVGKWEE